MGKNTMNLAIANSAFSQNSTSQFPVPDDRPVVQTRFSIGNQSRSSGLRGVVLISPLKWRSEIEAKLGKLIQLKKGWDGYRGMPVSFGTANFALQMLENVCLVETPMPQLIPGVNGDLQIEWHSRVADIELHVRRPNSVHAWRQNNFSNREYEEFDLTNNFQPILTWIKQLSEANASDNTTAAQ
jgi:hypothetical protein